jgi:hypothetical protein
MRKLRVYWRWFKWKLTKDGWEPTDTGWLLTLSLFALVLRIGLLRDGGITKFDQFIELRPSEMGDTIAGLFSALAFIWIIVTVFIQSRELRETRVEVKQQRVASQEMATAMRAQAQIFEDEKRQRNEAEFGHLFDQFVSGLEDEIVRGRINKMRWDFSNTEPSKRMFEGRVEQVKIIPYIDPGVTAEMQIHEIHGFVDEGIQELAQFIGNYRFEHLAEKKDLDEAKRLITNILEILDFCPQPHRERAHRMRLVELNESLERLINTSDIWKNP